jgi:phage-related protein
MANQAEVDLVVTAAGALPDLERQLTHIIDALEAGADEIDVQASLGVAQAVDTMTAQLDQAIAAVDRTDPTIDVDAALDLRQSLTNLREDVDLVVRDVNNGVDPLELTAALDFADSLRDITRDVQFIVQDVERSQEIQLQVELDEERVRHFREQIDALEGSTRNLNLRGGRSLGLFGASLAGLTVAGGQAVNALAAVAAAVKQVGPAAAVATSGILTIQLATNTLKLAMVGVSDAIQDAFDPSVKPETLAKEIEALAPNAQKFVKQLQAMREQLTAVQQSVQNRVFAGLDADLKTLGDTLGPIVIPALNRTADSLNAMARNAVVAAAQMGKQGVLGQALTGANTALETLEKAPARAVRSFSFLAAASSPALNRIALAVDKVSLDVQTKLQRAFESGALEKSIDQAVATIAQLGRALGNFGSGFRNIINGISQNGRGLFDILEQISQAFEDVTATKGFQQGLKALSDTARVVTATVLPLLSQALQALGPILEALAKPVQLLVQALGGALGEIITALGPVLESLATAVGKLIPVFTPLITLLGTLISSILPILIPLFDAFGKVFEAVAPFVKTVADTIGQFLAPILQSIGPIVEAFLTPFVTLYQTVFPKLNEILLQLQPSFVQVGEAIGRVIEKGAPLLQAFIDFSIALVEKFIPPLQPLIDLLVNLAEVALKGLAFVLNEIVAPALEIAVDLLNGDYRDAVLKSQSLSESFNEAVGKAFLELRNKINQALVNALSSVQQFVQNLELQFVLAVQRKVDEVVQKFRDLRDQIGQALADLPGRMFSIGVDIINGLTGGLLSKAGSLISAAQNIADTIESTIRHALDTHSPSRVTHAIGQDIVDGLINGMASRIMPLKKTVKELTEAVNGGIRVPTSAGLGTVNIPGATGQGTSVVNVFLDGKLFQQIIDDRLRTAQNQTARTYAMGIRI